ncbi:ketoacyl-ACP synthase III family protein [Streptomyces chartreusis]
MKVGNIFLAGIGACIPPSVGVDEAVRQGRYSAQERDSSGWRGAAVAGDLPAPQMAVLAARQALARAACAPSDIGMVIHATTLHQGPDGWSPQHYVQRHTVGGNAPAFELRQACNGMLCGMELSCHYLGSSAGRPATLVTGADNFGAPLVDRWRYAAGAGTNRASILGDAGTAVVLSAWDGFARLLAIGSDSLPELEEMYREGTPLFPPDCTVGRSAQVGARLARYARRHPDRAARARALLEEARISLARRTLEEAGVPPGKVTRATHVLTGGERYLRAVLQPIGIDPRLGMLDFGRNVGHLGVSDHVASLNHLLETGQLDQGDHVLMLGNGVGAALSCAVLEILHR